MAGGAARPVARATDEDAGPVADDNVEGRLRRGAYMVEALPRGNVSQSCKRIPGRLRIEYNEHTPVASAGYADDSVPNFVASKDAEDHMGRRQRRRVHAWIQLRGGVTIQSHFFDWFAVCGVLGEIPRRNGMHVRFHGFFLSHFL